MKDVLLLHDNARPHTSLRTREAIVKMARTVLPHPAHSPILAPSDCHVFGPVKDGLHGRHFVYDDELKQSFRDVLESQGREFYETGTQRLTQRWQKCVEMTENLRKNNLIVAKDV
jgi:histone-lysine N-methyltransferase SETMAR